MKIPNLRSPHDKVGGIVYFGRMIDKVWLHLANQLPSDYQPFFGKGFDARCVNFLGVLHEALVQRARAGGTEGELLEWCYSVGRKPSNEEIEVWNEFMRKRGWNDDSSERLVFRKQECGAAQRDDIQTTFDYIDFDEERLK